jgi:hypothetical protein
LIQRVRKADAIVAAGQFVIAIGALASYTMTLCYRVSSFKAKFAVIGETGAQRFWGTRMLSACLPFVATWAKMIFVARGAFTFSFIPFCTNLATLRF